MGDVVLGHAERAAQDERLEHRGVEPPVGLRHPGERAVGDRLVLERHAVGLAVEAVHVAERDARRRPAARARDGRASSSISKSRISASRIACCLARVVLEAGEQAVGGEDEQARVGERAEQHQHVAVLALAADLLGVHARGLVAVVAVGDQQLGVGERRLRARRSASGVRRPARACCACRRGRPPAANGSLGRDLLERAPGRAVAGRGRG